MEKVVAKLMDFGMDFQYENNGSHGEKVISYELSIEVNNQDGVLYYKCMGEEHRYDESDKAFDSIVQLINQECIEQTT